MGVRGHGRPPSWATPVIGDRRHDCRFFFFFFFFLGDRGHGRPRSWATAVMGDAGYW